MADARLATHTALHTHTLTPTLPATARHALLVAALGGGLMAHLAQRR